MKNAPGFRKKAPNVARNLRRPPRTGLRWLLAGVCILLTAGTTWAVFEYFVWNRLPSELVGKWVVEGGEQDGATFDFYRNGTMTGRINVQGKEGIIDARVRVVNHTLYITTLNPHSGSHERRTQDIESLTRTQLVLVDENGTRFQMARAD
jgi:uncharacterized protein (TIGR03066 family)